MTFRLLFLLLSFLSLLFGSCQKEVSRVAGAQLQLRFQNVVNGQPLQLQHEYQNHFGETFSVSRFKYYVSNIALLHNGKTTLLPNTYFLVDDTNDSTQNIAVSIPSGTFDGLQFLLGVDSTRNVSGAQTGALDPALDMFWTWNTGYIMTKLEGQSPLSTAPNNRIQYHIGGFTGEYSALRTIRFPFPAAVTVRNDGQLNVAVQVELQRWFDGVHQLKIADGAVSMTPGELSSKFADNAASLFHLTSAAVQ